MPWSRWLSALGAVWVLLVILACGASGDREREREATRARLAPLWDPIREHLGSAAAALPPPGSVTEGAITPVEPPLRYESPTAHTTLTSQLTANFELIDARNLLDPRSRPDGRDFHWDPGSSSFLDCLRATQPTGYINDSTERICRERATTDYVVAMRAVSYERPQVDADGAHFVPGSVTLEGFIIRVASGAIERQFRLVVDSDESVDFSFARRPPAVRQPEYIWRYQSGRRRRLKNPAYRAPPSRRYSAQDAADSDLEFNAIAAVRELLRPTSVGLVPATAP